MASIKRLYPDDYDGLKSVEHHIDDYLDFNSMKNLNIQINQSDILYSQFQSFDHIERVKASWPKT